jgi:colicin import membrane protein
MRLPELGVVGRYAFVVLAFATSLMLPLAQAEAASVNAASVPQLMDSLSLKERYPAGSIQSDQQADEALRQVRAAQSMITTEFTDDERLCHAQFFATACISNAKERRRRSSARVHSIELEANQYKRHSRVTERDKALAEKRGSDDAAAPGFSPAEGEAKTHGDSPLSPPVSTDTGDKANNRKAAGRRAAQHQAKLKDLQAKDLAEAKKRAENIVAYEKKVRDAEARQKYIAEKKKEK